LGNGEVFVKLVKGRACPAASTAYNTGAKFEFSFRSRTVKQAVKKRSRRACGGGKMYSGAKDNAVRLSESLGNGVHHIVVKNTFACLPTGHTGNTASDWLIANLKNFGIDPIFCQLFFDDTQTSVGTAV
jgi:hypothetical protein